MRLGVPIKVSVSVTNEGPQEVEVDRSATAFDCFEVIDSDGRVLPYVGFDGQIMIKRTRVQSSSTVMIAEALDLTDKYLVQKPGKYSVRLARGASGLPSSRAITVDVAPGQLSVFDELAARLIPVCPKDWHIAKDRRGEVAPFGRTPVVGQAAPCLP